MANQYRGGSETRISSGSPKIKRGIIVGEQKRPPDADPRIPSKGSGSMGSGGGQKPPSASDPVGGRGNPGVDADGNEIPQRKGKGK